MCADAVRGVWGATARARGLSAAAGISKTILVGHDAGEEAVYAMVKGQDLVFTFSKALRDKLLQPLYKSVQA